MPFLCTEVKKIYISLQGMISSSLASSKNQKRKKASSDASTRRLQISAPFNFEHKTVTLPGLSSEEILVLREKAAATRLGIHQPGHCSPSDSPVLSSTAVSFPSTCPCSASAPPALPPLITAFGTSYSPSVSRPRTPRGKQSSRPGTASNSSLRSSSSGTGRQNTRKDGIGRSESHGNLKSSLGRGGSGGHLPLSNSQGNMLLLDAISPLDLDVVDDIFPFSFGNGGHGQPGNHSAPNIDFLGASGPDWDFAFGGNPVSPLSPSPVRGRSPMGQKKGATGRV
ncbi:hypothetical protein QBC35DRAFT_298027 [Podospora australis]|uniref:Uncharacterized protein n=1 Tax=Podospora australis TaxID=1536484 RepID=A0AAN6WSW0_9PEZI|nr:hypothetical protein QBC35DRAFT_298027 [Podospora australis]